MITVYRVHGQGLQPTRLHLPDSQWGKTAVTNIVKLGYLVEVTDEPQHPDTRPVDELERVNELLGRAMPE